MDKLHYDLICKILTVGAPALAGELIDSLNKVLTENRTYKEKENN